MTLSIRSTLEPSARGLRNLPRHDEIDFSDEIRKMPWYDAEKHPDGLIDLSGSSNEGMRDYLEEYCLSYSRNFKLSSVLGYGPVVGPPDLNDTMSNFFNEWFKPATPIQSTNILATNGVSSLLDMVTFNVCDEGQGVLLPVPNYSMFPRDMCSRSGVTLIPVHMETPELQFQADWSTSFIELLDAARLESSRRGVVAKALVISNPSNPLGRFYSKETLLKIAQFCGKYHMHLIADEIYALSGFESDKGREILSNFTSVLSIEDDTARGISKENIHCLYGASKDWGMGGLRLGFLVTRNQALWDVCRRVALFTWITPFSAQFWGTFFNDKQNVQRFVRENRSRLQAKYREVATLMDELRVPYLQANGGLFVWIDLSRWLTFFNGTDEPVGPGETREVQLCRYLIQHGVHLSMGQEYMSMAPGRFRLVYTAPDDQALIAVRRISQAIRELESREPVYAINDLSNSSLSDAESYIDLKSDFAQVPERKTRGDRVRACLRSLNCLKQ